MWGLGIFGCCESGRLRLRRHAGPLRQGRREKARRGGILRQKAAGRPPRTDGTLSAGGG